MFRLSKKLKSLKAVIKDINREHYSDLENRVKEAHSLHLSYQNRLLTNQSTDLASLEKTAHKIWMVLALAEEKFFHQRARVKWVESGDSNSAYFNRVMATRHATNQIHYLIDNAGQRIDNLMDVQTNCVDYFVGLLGGSTIALSAFDKAQIKNFTSFCYDETTCNLLQEDITEAETSEKSLHCLQVSP